MAKKQREIKNSAAFDSKHLHQSITCYISIQDVFSRLEKETRFSFRVENISLLEATRRILAKDIVAAETIPLFDTAQMDGYAANSADLVGASKKSPVTLRIQGEMLFPGQVANLALKRGEGWPIATGAYLPDGADVVVPIEDVTITPTKYKNHTSNQSNMVGNAPLLQQPQQRRLGQDYKPSRWIEKGCEAIGFQDKLYMKQRRKRDYEPNAITIHRSLSSKAFVYQAGSDTMKGELLLSRGTAIRAQDIGMLASLGIQQISVFAKPRIAIVPTGNELTDDISRARNLSSSSTAIQGRRSVPNSNTPVLAGLIENSGAIPDYRGIASDNADVIAAKIRDALLSCDMIITLGGSSVGKLDLVETAINSLGKPGVIAHGIKIDRGRVSGVGIINRKPIIILPGPIQGAVSGFIALAFPLIEQMSGATHTRLLQVQATLTESWHARKRFPNFTKVVYVSLLQNLGAQNNAGYLKAKPLQAESESKRILVQANGYVIVPESVTEIAAGEHVCVFLLPGFSF